MATESCGCCGLFSKRRRKEPKPAQHIHKHYSEEHLLGFTIEEVDKATQTASRIGSKSNLIQYTPPYDIGSCLGKSAQQDKSTFKELGSSYIGSQYNVENDGSVQTPVRYTQHVVRSEVLCPLLDSSFSHFQPRALFPCYLYENLRWTLLSAHPN